MALNTQHEAGQQAVQTQPANLLAEVIGATEEQMTYDQRKELAEMMARAGVFPDVKDKARAMAAIEIGRFLSMQPAEALMAVQFGAQGVPSISIHWQARRLRQLGHDYEILEHDGAHCKIRFYRREQGRIIRTHEISEIMSRLNQIRIHDKMQGDKATLGGKWNYKAYAEDMLYAFVMRRGIKRHFPEVLGPFAVPDEQEAHEMGEAGIAEGEPLTQERVAETIEDLTGASEETPAETFDRLAQDTGYVPQAERVDTTTGEITEPAEMPRPVLLSAVTVACKEAAFTPKPFRVWLQSQWPSKSRLAECTDDELRQVLGHLQQYGTDALTRDFDPVAEQAEMPLGDPQVPARVNEPV